MSKDDKTSLVPVKGGALVPAPAKQGFAVGKAARGKTGAFLQKIRSAKAETAVAPPVAPKVGERQSLVSAALAPKGRPRLVLGIDATASREHAWDAAKQVTDALFKALPGELDVALAVHGASRLHTFTDFVSDARKLRDKAASVHCQAGNTRMLEILEKVRTTSDCRVVVYIGDVFEESLAEGLALCDALRLKGTKVIVLHDQAHGDGTWPDTAAKAFAEMARRTGGCVLPFSPDSLQQLRDLLQAIAVFAIGGVKLLEAKRKSLPGAQLLLEHLTKKDGNGP